MCELTKEGRESLITRLEEDPDKNVERWKKLPYLMNFQDRGPTQARRDRAGGYRFRKTAAAPDSAADHPDITAAAGPRYSPPREAGAGRCCSRWPT